MTPSTRLRLEEILERIGQNRPVALAERIERQTDADRDRGLADGLRQARRRQLLQRPADGLDQLLEGLNLGCAQPDDTFRPGDDDLEGWLGVRPTGCPAADGWSDGRPWPLRRLTQPVPSGQLHRDRHGRPTFRRRYHIGQPYNRQRCHRHRGLPG